MQNKRKGYGNFEQRNSKKANQKSNSCCSDTGGGIFDACGNGNNGGSFGNAIVASALAEGSFSEGMYWQLDNNGTLTISGKGAMPDWTDLCDVPWSSCLDNIKTVSIAEGVTYIGAYAFSGCTSLTSIFLPAAEKKRIVHEEYGIPMNKEIDKEVDDMCNISSLYINRGRAEGIEIGAFTEKIKVITEMLKNNIPIPIIASIVRLSVEETEKIIRENT